jgi:hypothetical protein
MQKMRRARMEIGKIRFNQILSPSRFAFNKGSGNTRPGSQTLIQPRMILIAGRRFQPAFCQYTFNARNRPFAVLDVRFA